MIKPARILLRIRRLLYAYAFARPWTRFSLKVSKTLDKNSSWNYAPKAGVRTDIPEESLLRNATIQTFGKQTADQCTWISQPISTSKSIETDPQEEGRIPDPENTINVSGFLASIDCSDISSLSNLGHYVSIDRRPVACTIGTLADIVGHYKSCIKAVKRLEKAKRITDPLLILNLDCPQGSYDINIEPAKDDVLFHDSAAISCSIKNFFDHFYGVDHEQAEKERSTEGAHVLNSSEKYKETQDSRARPDFGPGMITPPSRKAVVPDVYSHGTTGKEGREVLQDPGISNPWVIAKMNATYDKHTPARAKLVDHVSYIPTPVSQRVNGQSDSESDDSNSLPYEISNDRFPYPLTSRRQVQTEQEDFCESVPPNQKRRSELVECGAKGRQQSIASLLNRSKTISEPRRDDSEAHRHQSQQVHHLTGQSFTTPSMDEVNRSQFDFGDGHIPQAVHPVQRPIQMPPRLLEIQSRESLDIRPRPSALFVDPDSDLAFTLDYEDRKQRATKEYMKQLKKQTRLDAAASRKEKSGQLTIDSVIKAQVEQRQKNSPHENRYMKAKAALQSPSQDQPLDSGPDSTFEAAQVHDQAPRPRFMKVEKKDRVVDFVLPYSTSVEIVSAHQGSHLEYESWPEHLAETDGFEHVDTPQIRAWEIRLQHLSKSRFGDECLGSDGPRFDLHRALMLHAATMNSDIV